MIGFRPSITQRGNHFGISANGGMDKGSTGITLLLLVDIH
jgi:hypothetical protein